MTFKEYKEWLAERRSTWKKICDDTKDQIIKMGICGMVAAYEECLKKCPDFFEDDSKSQAESDSIAAETAYTMKKIKELREDMASKAQSATDKAENLKKQLKESKERAESAQERVRYLERKLRDVESLNDQLLRELARREYKEESGE